MAGKTPEQQSVLNHIWHEQHLGGKSADAADTAKRELSQIVGEAEFPQNPKNPNAAFLVELARQNVVTARAAAEKEPQFVRAFTLLREAVETAVSTYPIGKTPEQAQERGQYWGRALSGENITTAALRDLLNLSRTLEKAFGDGRFLSLANNLLSTLQKVIELDPTERFALITLTEEAPYAQARAAYEQFIELYAPVEKLRPYVRMDDETSGPQFITELRTTPDQFITVACRMIARAWHNHHPVDALTMRHHYRQSLHLIEEELKRQLAHTAMDEEERKMKQDWLDNLWSNASEEAFKENFSKPVKVMLNRAFKPQWNKPLSRQNNKNHAYQEEDLLALMDFSYVGTGGGQSLPIGVR